MLEEVKTLTLDLSAPITSLRYVGARSAARLKKLGIETIRQLLWHLPTRYEDYSQSVPIGQIVPGEKMSIRGRILNIANKFVWPRKMTITTATLQDDSGAVRAVWFNQPYIADALSEGVEVSMAGKVVLDKRGLYLSSPVYEKIVPSFQPQNGLRHTGRLVPVYPETDGVTSKFLRYLIQPVLDKLQIDDPLPQAIKHKYGFLDLTEAIKNMHYPADLRDVEPSRDRLAFDDILLFQLKALHDRRLMNKLRSPRVPMDNDFMKGLVGELPFSLTHDQRVAAVEILQDMGRAFPMNRLLEGDVGSGKTVVAILAALHAAHHGWQTVILAPTEVLALQHYRTLSSISSSKVHIALLTGSSARLDNGEATKASVKRSISDGLAKVIVGTHAVLQNDVRFAHLSLVVIDEQHRFGIAQRAALTKAERHDKGKIPHLLSMTATPIPRTLALTVFGDLDISIIREKPKGRQAIITKVAGLSERSDIYKFVREQVKAGRQVFVICPRIEHQDGGETERLGRHKLTQRRLQLAEIKAVTDEHKKLSQQIFPDLRVAMMHGRLKTAEKQAIMHEFREGWHDILVATSVIEVGVDVPNATIMIIEGADRFGLAQLHQFRGRVGRGEHQSYCFLFPTEDVGAQARLAALERSDDGFELAETDMKLRGPGEFFGLKQSGLPDLTMAALANVDLIKKARVAAQVLIKRDPELKGCPGLRSQLNEFRRLSHFE